MNVCCRTFSWIHRNATVIMYTPLKALGFPISFVQILHRIKQPWLMSPYKHGLFFVLNDGFCFQGLPRPPLHHYPTDAQTLHRSRLRTTASLLSIFCLLPASGAQWSTEQLQGSLWGDWKQTVLLYVVFSLLFVMCHCDWKASVKKVLIWLLLSPYCYCFVFLVIDLLVCKINNPDGDYESFSLFEHSICIFNEVIKAHGNEILSFFQYNKYDTRTELKTSYKYTTMFLERIHLDT